MEFKFQLDRTAGFAVKCSWVLNHFLVGRFFKQKHVLVSVQGVSSVPPKVVWSFELNFYPELTVPQVSDCCPLGRLGHRYLCVRIEIDQL